MNIKKNTFGILFILLIASCKPSGNIVTVKYPGEGTEPGSGFIYALPRTNLRVDVDVVRTTYIKGPYSDFAKKYLAIDKVINEENTYWRIDDIQINSYDDADPNHVYMVKTGENQVSFQNFFELTKQGLILDMTQPKYQPRELKYLEDVENRTVDFKDLTVYGNIGFVKDTLYRLVFKDSAFVKVPMLKSQAQAKSLDEKAEEAADFIFEIRNQRLLFIGGENSPLPEGNAVQKALNELNRLEEEYLSLFIGKTYKDTVRFSFEVIPSGNPVEDRTTLFRFSEEFGVFNESIVEGTPVIIEFQPGQDGITSAIQDKNPASASQNKMYYRIADKTAVNVSMANQTLLQERRLIYQYGKIVSLPLSVSLCTN